MDVKSHKIAFWLITLVLLSLIVGTAGAHYISNDISEILNVAVVRLRTGAFIIDSLAHRGAERQQ